MLSIWPPPLLLIPAQLAFGGTASRTESPCLITSTLSQRSPRYTKGNCLHGPQKREKHLQKGLSLLPLTLCPGQCLFSHCFTQEVLKYPFVICFQVQSHHLVLNMTAQLRWLIKDTVIVHQKGTWSQLMRKDGALTNAAVELLEEETSSTPVQKPQPRKGGSRQDQVS